MAKYIHKPAYIGVQPGVIKSSCSQTILMYTDATMKTDNSQSNQINDQQIQLTQAGLDELKQELQELVDIKLPEAIDRVTKAREYGDLTENSEYHSARDDQQLIQTRIDQIGEIIERASVIQNTKSKTVIGVGSKVTIQKDGTQTKKTFEVAGEFESEPGENKISSVSPLGKSLMGKKKGDIAQVQAPAGVVRYKIIDVK